MELHIQSPDGILALAPSLPKDWTGAILQGSQPYYYQGEAGTLTIQKFQAPQFSICYTVLHLLRKLQLHWKEEAFLRFQYLLQGSFSYRGNGDQKIKLKAGRVNTVWSPGRETIAHFEKGTHELFQIALKPELVQQLASHFPEVNPFPPEAMAQWIGEERTRDIHEILLTPYGEEIRRFFYETKIREHLLSFLVTRSKPGTDEYTEEEIERVFKVDHKILSDLQTHHTTEQLARFAKMPEAKLIAAFRNIIGTSMFDRYKEAKLQKAKQYLLETDVQVKVLYELVGYESYTGFVEAFTKRFGLSPLRYRKKFRPFD